MMFNPWVILAFVAFVGLTNGYSFYKGHDWATDKCNAAALAAENTQLRTQLAAARAAAQADRKALDDAKAETERLEEAARELEGNISAGVCFPDGPDADRVRGLWGGVTVRPTGGSPR